MAVEKALPPKSFTCTQSDQSSCEAAINQTCFFQAYIDVRQIGFLIVTPEIQQIIIFISCILLFLRALAIQRFKLLRVHPMELVMVSQFWCAITYWCISTSGLSCNWHTYDLLSLTLFYSKEPYTQFKAVYNIYKMKLGI